MNSERASSRGDGVVHDSAFGPTYAIYFESFVWLP